MGVTGMIRDSPFPQQALVTVTVTAMDLTDMAVTMGDLTVTDLTVTVTDLTVSDPTDLMVTLPLTAMDLTATDLTDMVTDLTVTDLMVTDLTVTVTDLTDLTDPMVMATTTTTVELNTFPPVHTGTPVTDMDTDSVTDLEVTMVFLTSAFITKYFDFALDF